MKITEEKSTKASLLLKGQVTEDTTEKLAPLAAVLCLVTQRSGCEGDTENGLLEVSVKLDCKRSLLCSKFQGEERKTLNEHDIQKCAARLAASLLAYRISCSLRFLRSPRGFSSKR